MGGTGAPGGSSSWPFGRTRGNIAGGEGETDLEFAGGAEKGGKIKILMKKEASLIHLFDDATKGNVVQRSKSTTRPFRS